ncbi:hypothetical protein ACQ86G_28460 [Roseateles chitinivorans]|uniref:hypothetical protein n=1 Tax=Roseateles chitinivorans TaxID=2917965 RepID=UPI003D67BC76
MTAAALTPFAPTALPDDDRVVGDATPIGTPAALAAAAAAALLAACGGGGGSDDASAGPDSNPQNNVPTTEPEAARFLGQAGFAASAADLTSVKTSGFSRWLDQQFDAPVPRAITTGSWTRAGAPRPTATAWTASTRRCGAS